MATRRSHARIGASAAFLGGLRNGSRNTAYPHAIARENSKDRRIVPLMIAFLTANGPAPAAHSVPTRDRGGIFEALFGHCRWPTLLLWAGFFLVVLTLHLLLNWLPLLLLGRGLTKTQATLVQVGFNVGGAAMALWMGALLDSRWQRPSVAVCPRACS